MGGSQQSLGNLHGHGLDHWLRNMPQKKALVRSLTTLPHWSLYPSQKKTLKLESIFGQGKQATSRDLFTGSGTLGQKVKLRTKPLVSGALHRKEFNTQGNITWNASSRMQGKCPQPLIMLPEMQGETLLSQREQFQFRSTLQAVCVCGGW